jgi:hypothetical protein
MENETDEEKGISMLEIHTEVEKIFAIKSLSSNSRTILKFNRLIYMMISE